MTFSTSPSLWPAELVEQIVRYAAGIDSPISNLPCYSDSATDTTHCLVVDNTVQFKNVCSNWARIVYVLLSRHMCLTIDTDGFARSSYNCECNKYCLYQNIQKNEAWRFVRQADVEISLDAVADGTFAENWDTQPPFTNVKHLRFKVYGAPTAITNRSMAAINKQTAKFTAMLIRVFPHVKTIAVHEQPHSSNASTRIVAGIYNKLLRHYQQHSLHVYGAALRNVSYETCAKHISTQMLPMFGGLTSIVLNSITSSEDGVIGLLHRNNTTLRKVDLVFSLSRLCVGVMLNAERQPIVYPHVEWLQLAVFVAEPFDRRAFITGANPFPRLRHLLIPGAYPFSNDVLLRDSDNTLETLSLGVCREEVESFASLGLFTKKYTNLHTITIQNTPVSCINLLPLVSPSVLVFGDDALRFVNMALGFSSKLEKLCVKDIKVVPLVKALKYYASKLQCLNSLVVADILLELDDVLQIAMTLPTLINLEYSANSLDTTSVIAMAKTMSLGSNSKLESVIIHQQPDNSDGATHTEAIINQMADYSKSLCMLLPSIRRIQFVVDACYSLDLCNNEQLQDVCARQLKPSIAEYPPIVKIMQQEERQPDVFSLCYPQKL